MESAERRYIKIESGEVKEGFRIHLDISHKTG
jgi:hypothetical protein